MESNTSQPRRRRSWIEMSVALTALTVSVVSLFIAVRQTQVMDRQLAASVWPALQYSTSNLRGTDRVITMSIENVGIGPARVRTFSLWHKGAPIADPNQFLRDCCAPDNVPFRVIQSFVTGRIIPAGEEVTFFTLPRDSANPQVFERFNGVRGDVEVRMCFCSVLEDCWTIGTHTRPEPQPVAVCEERKPGS